MILIRYRKNNFVDYLFHHASKSSTYKADEHKKNIAISSNSVSIFSYLYIKIINEFFFRQFESHLLILERCQTIHGRRHKLSSYFVRVLCILACDFHVYTVKLISSASAIIFSHTWIPLYLLFANNVYVKKFHFQFGHIRQKMRSQWHRTSTVIILGYGPKYKMILGFIN